jgi:3-(3-hydroxy-phenyl)propionate hydroxylase
MDVPATHECDVLIVGLGPTGALLANLLGLNGWSVIGIERHETVFDAARAVHFDDEAMRVFQAAGLSREVANTSEPFAYMEFRRSFHADPMVTAKIATDDQPFGHARSWWFHQPTLEQHLRDGLRRFSNVTSLYGFTVSEIEQTSDHVFASAANAQGENVRVRARYLVGCDGGRSFVRKSAGIPLRSAGFDECWLVTDIRTRSGEKDKTLPANHAQICDPKQPATYVPIAGPYYRWEFLVVDEAAQATSDEAAIRERLSSYVDLQTVEIIRVARYTFHGLWAEDWVSGRVILAGDAAHQMPPFLGQGLCSGVRDAQALAWRLDLILSGRCAPHILEDYTQERCAHVCEIIKGAILLGRIIQTRNRAVAFLRDHVFFRALRRIAPFRRAFIKNVNRKKPLKRGCVGSHSSLAGQLALQPRVTAAQGRIELLDDVLGRGFAVVAREGVLNENRSVLNELCRHLPCRMFEFSVDGSNGSSADHTGMLRQWFDQSGIDFVLIRPDRYVFDAGTKTQLSEAVSELLARLSTNGRMNASPLESVAAVTRY